MLGIRKYTLTLLLVILTLVSGILFKDNIAVLGEVLLTYVILNGLYLNYNVKSKNVTLSKEVLDSEKQVTN